MDQLQSKKARLQKGDALILQVRGPRLSSDFSAFAAVLGDGSVATWGDPDCAVSSSVQGQLKNVQQVQANGCACAAIPMDPW